jgi:DNA-binding MarR family transcriptional regulator
MSEAHNPANVLNRLFEVTVQLGETMDEGLVDRGLTRARATVIWSLHHGGPMRPRAIAEILRVAPRSVTDFVDALERAGFVSREPDPGDRRAILVALTDKGRAAGAALHAEQEEFARALFRDLGEEERAAFAATLERILAGLQGVDFAKIRKDVWDRSGII